VNEGATVKTHANRVAVVTGAARGIGQSICWALARQGADVIKAGGARRRG